MAHKKKKFADSDNSRKAFRWRKRNNCMTHEDIKRDELNGETNHGSKIQALIESGEVKVKIKGSKKVWRGK